MRFGKSILLLAALAALLTGCTDDIFESESSGAASVAVVVPEGTGDERKQALTKEELEALYSGSTIIIGD